jgi:chromosomal replication initiator protein
MKAWDEFLEQQEKDLGKDIVTTWLRPLKIVRFDACNIYLEARDSFQALWFEEHIRHRAQTHLLNNNKKRIKVHVSVSAASQKNRPTTKKGPPAPTSKPLQAFSISHDDLNPHSAFDTFVITEENKLSYQLLKESSEALATSLSTSGATSDLFFNPIFIHGPTGVGKTHLLMATALLLKNNNINVLYCRAETFTEHVVSAIRAGEMQAFRKKYRNVDVLIVDDIHILSRKNATQEEFFHTFNTLHLAEKQIILSGNCSPQELKYIEPRLVSRFEWGIVVPMTPLDKKGSRDLLDSKTKSLGITLTSDVIDFLLTTFISSSKALCKAVEALVLRSHLDSYKAPSAPITYDMSTRYLGDLIDEEKKAAITPDRIITAVSEHHGIRVEDILGRSHAKEYALPRQIAMFLCRSHLRLPFMRIGDIFSRDHSTVMTNVKQIKSKVEKNDPSLSFALSSIRSKLNIAVTQ